jgi:Tfp pilus assembly protein PilF
MRPGQSELGTAGYLQEKKYEDAIADFDEAIRLAPSSGSSYYFRGITFRAKNDNARAKTDFDKAKQLGYKAP